MKLLFTSEEVVDIYNGKYYSTNLGQHLAKYSYMGEITCVCYCREVEQTKLPEVDKSIAKFVFTQKENSLSAKIFGSKKNHEIIKGCVKNVDMVVAHVPSWNSEHSITIAKEIGLPYMAVVVGCVWDALWNYDWRGKLMAAFEYLKQKQQVGSSTHVLYVTEHFLQTRYPTKGKMEHASNVCINKVPESVLSNRLAKIDSYTQGCQLNIVTVGAVNVRYKGQEHVIRAIAKLNKEMGYNYHYYLVGGGENSFLKGVVSEYNIEKFVHFLGALPHNKVTEMLDKMDIYIQPSMTEGLPRAVIEGLSRALVTLGANVGGIPELINPDYLFSRGDVDGIIDILSTQMSSEKMKAQAAANFIKASEYTLDIINARRQKFFDTFIQDSFEKK